MELLIVGSNFRTFRVKCTWDLNAFVQIIKLSKLGTTNTCDQNDMAINLSGLSNC